MRICSIFFHSFSFITKFDWERHIWRPPAYPQYLHKSLLSMAEKFEIVFLLDKRQALPIDETKKLVKLSGKKHSSIIILFYLNLIITLAL